MSSVEVCQLESWQSTWDSYDGQTACHVITSDRLRAEHTVDVVGTKQSSSAKGSQQLHTDKGQEDAGRLSTPIIKQLHPSLSAAATVASSFHVILLSVTIPPSSDFTAIRFIIRQRPRVKRLCLATPHGQFTARQKPCVTIPTAANLQFVIRLSPCNSATLQFAIHPS